MNPSYQEGLVHPLVELGTSGFSPHIPGIAIPQVRSNSHLLDTPLMVNHEIHAIELGVNLVPIEPVEALHRNQDT